MSKNIVGIEHKSSKFDDEIKIEWHLGLYCNFNCSYCSEESHTDIPSHLSLNNFKIAVANILNEIDVNKIRIGFTGGEPTTNPNFYEMLQHLNSVGITKVLFTTNGSKDLQYYKNCFDLVDTIIFSYHMEYKNFTPQLLLDLKEYINTKSDKKWLKVHVMFLPTTLTETQSLVTILSDNNIQYIIRRISPSYFKNHINNEYWQNGKLKKGKVVSPYDNTTISSVLNTENSGVDRSDIDTYYSQEELDYLLIQEEDNYNYENVILYYDDGSIELTNVSKLVAVKKNNFIGWKCWVGMQSLRIGGDGTISAGNCGIPPLGNILTSFSLLTSPVVCTNQWCCSATNLNTTKMNQKCNVRVNNDF